jgi:hypothetical protein
MARLKRFELLSPEADYFRFFRPYRSWITASHELHLVVDYDTKSIYRSHRLAHRGASSRGDPEGGARYGVPRCGSQPQPREAHGTARRALRPGCEELAARAAEDNAADGSAADRHKSPWWSAERRASFRRGTQGVSQTPGLPATKARSRASSTHMAGPPDAAASGRLSALRHPSGWRIQSMTRARSRRGNDVRCSHGLFEIVSRICTRCRTRTRDARIREPVPWDTAQYMGRPDSIC